MGLIKIWLLNLYENPYPKVLFNFYILGGRLILFKLVCVYIFYF